MTVTRLSRFIAATRTDVYKALLDPDAVKQWMVPNDMTSEIHQFESREGGSFRISLSYKDETETGKTSGQTDTFHGRFLELVPNSEVVQVIEFETDEPSLQGEMTVRYLLADAPDGTVITGLHEDLPPGLSPEQNELGWRMSMDKLADLLERE
jgi:uncharacterized protein YndB with AHSA1/START domain